MKIDVMDSSYNKKLKCIQKEHEDYYDERWELYRFLGQLQSPDIWEAPAYMYSPSYNIAVAYGKFIKAQDAFRESDTEQTLINFYSEIKIMVGIIYEAIDKAESASLKLEMENFYELENI